MRLNLNSQSVPMLAAASVLIVFFTNCNSMTSSSGTPSNRNSANAVDPGVTPPSISIASPIEAKRSSPDCSYYDFSVQATSTSGTLTYLWKNSDETPVDTLVNSSILSFSIDDPRLRNSYKVTLSNNTETLTSSAIQFKKQFIKPLKIASGGGYHSCATYDDGKVRCSGLNWYGQIGDKKTDIAPIPTQVQDLPANATEVTVGPHHSCANVAGAVYCWGHNNNGQLGDNSMMDRSTPVIVKSLETGVSSVVAGGMWGGSPGSESFYDHGFSCAIQNGGVFCWGYGKESVLGPNANLENQKTPVAIPVLTQNVQSIAAGYQHACAAMNGEAYCWGLNSPGGRLGDGTTTAKETPVKVPGMSTVTSVAVGNTFSCALDGGRVKCWGSNSNGQMGQVPSVFSGSKTPVEVPGLNDVEMLAASDYTGCAVKKNFEVWCWGMAIHSHVPKLMKTLTQLPTSIGVSGMGGAGSVFIVADGFQYGYGQSSNGILGNNNIEKAPPVLSCLEETN